MKTKLIIPAACILGLALAVAWMTNIFNERISPGTVASAAQPVGDPMPVVAREITIVEPVPGTIVAKQATDISSRILARVEKILVRAGDTVKQGDLLIQLEQTDLLSRQAQATELVSGTRARLKEADLQNKRIKELFAQGMVARAELDQTQAATDSLQAELSQAQQLLNEKQTTLLYSTITAPISGRIVDRYAEPGDTATPGRTLLSLYNPQSLRIEAHVREQLALSLNIGDAVSIEVPSLNRKLQGTIDELVPAANAGARSFQIHVLMDYSVDLLPGMFARLLFDRRNEERILVPIDRIATVGQLDIVWVLLEGGSQKRLVTTGKKYNDLVEVLSGLNEGDRILPIQP
ncbi:MAG: efflux transporter periplasmic adaptor subunit [Gammaproteobacteria bacterium]|jgi:RND family efflux transporter MFP subunit|nr:efflux transporter periplasmic adaptor subunit [Gammaproteobacteria bacterium]|tara:strand:+ start:308 stop:1354 length:1047 start_codon:yes stop_codon:yes gene_type:complete